jgi:renal tumor antigen
MEFDFPTTEGTGITKLIPHASPDVQDLIVKLLVYNPDNRITASQALKHPWFKEIKEQEAVLKQQYAVTQQSVRAANNFADSLSQYSKHSDEVTGSDMVGLGAGGSTQLEK